MGIFASATIANPPFDVTVFADIPNLRTHTETEINTPWARDEKSTEEWLAFINNYKETNETKPFFGVCFFMMGFMVILLKRQERGHFSQLGKKLIC